MNIGFDFDKVFIHHPHYIPATVINNLSKNNTTATLSYRIPSKAEQLLRLSTHTQAIRPPIMENIQLIENIARTNKNKYFVISGRFGYLKKRTENFIRKYQLNKFFDGLFFNYENRQPHEFKEQMIHKLEIKRYIDDDYGLLDYLSKRNRDIVFFWLNNKKSESIYPNLIAITHLKDALNDL